MTGEEYTLNILLNINNFGEPFARDVLRRSIRPWMRVLIVPFSFHEDWITCAEDFDRHYARGQDEFEDIAQAFAAYGIRRRNLRTLHYFRDTPRVCREKLRHADVLFFTGGYPDKLLYRIDEKRLRRAICGFRGIVMGTSAGAMIQLDHYHVTPEEDGQDYEYHDGLGLLSGFDIEVHYEPAFAHLAGMVTALRLHHKTIFALPNHGGLVVDGERLTLLGDAFAVDEGDADALQAELDRLLEDGDETP